MEYAWTSVSCWPNRLGIINVAVKDQKISEDQAIISQSKANARLERLGGS